MFSNRYSNFLTILLIVAIIAIIGILGYFAFDYFGKVKASNDARQQAEFFIKETEENVIEENNNNVVAEAIIPINTNVVDLNAITTETNAGSNQSVKKYKGHVMVGTIEIPRTKIKYPILENVTKTSLETSVAIMYTYQGLNKPGNTVISGHNYRNGTFFSNNYKIENGDPIYITDLDGNKMKYIVYNKFVTTPEDSQYITRDTQGAREISLSTCTDDSSARTIILAKESV